MVANVRAIYSLEKIRRHIDRRKKTSVESSAQDTCINRITPNATKAPFTCHTLLDARAKKKLVDIYDGYSREGSDWHQDL